MLQLFLAARSKLYGTFSNIHGTISVQFEFHTFKWIQVHFLMIVKLSIQRSGPDIYLAYFSSKLDVYLYNKSNWRNDNY